MKSGKKTAEFGKWLTKYLQAINQYSVYYDHGNQQINSAVAVIKGFLGDTVTNKNRLADVDVLIVKNNEAIIVIEIEESNLPPKKLLGDLFALVMCNQFAVRKENENEYFEASRNTILIIAGVVPNQESEQNKIRDIIIARLQNFHFPKDAIQKDKIKIVTGKDISETLDKLKSEVKSSLQ